MMPAHLPDMKYCALKRPKKCLESTDWVDLKNLWRTGIPAPDMMLMNV